MKKGDEETSATFSPFNRNHFRNKLTSLCIDSTEDIVEQNDGCVSVDGASERDSSALATAEGHAALADKGGVAVGKECEVGM